MFPQEGAGFTMELVVLFGICLVMGLPACRAYRRVACELRREPSKHLKFLWLAAYELSEPPLDDYIIDDQELMSNPFT